MAELPVFPACADSQLRTCYQIRGGLWFPCRLSPADSQTAEAQGCEPVQRFVSGSNSIPAEMGLTEEQCKSLFRRFRSAFKRDPRTGLLTLPLVPKGTTVQIQPEPDQAPLSTDEETLFDALWESARQMGILFPSSSG
jgi:hypothetical protein